MKCNREGLKWITSNNWSRVFQRALKSGEEGGWKFFVEEFWQFNAFLMLKIRFSSHQLIETGMRYVYIKSEVKKMMQQQWTASNEACWVITWKFLFCQGFFSDAGNEQFFCCWTRFSPRPQGFPQGLDEGVEQSILGGGNKQDQGRGTFMVGVICGDIIQGDNSAGHYFVLKDLILINFFK